MEVLKHADHDFVGWNYNKYMLAEAVDRPVYGHFYTDIAPCASLVREEGAEVMDGLEQAFANSLE